MSTCTNRPGTKGGVLAYGSSTRTTTRTVRVVFVHLALRPGHPPLPDHIAAGHASFNLGQRALAALLGEAGDIEPAQLLILQRHGNLHRFDGMKHSQHLPGGDVLACVHGLLADPCLQKARKISVLCN